jgi:hypothetical protein
MTSSQERMKTTAKVEGEMNDCLERMLTYDESGEGKKGSDKRSDVSVPYMKSTGGVDEIADESLIRVSIPLDWGSPCRHAHFRAMFRSGPAATPRY